jgi:hypothetical protein
MDHAIVLQLDSSDADPAELDDALRVLQRELSESSELDVQQKMQPAPPNTKSAAALVALAVTLLNTKAAASAVGVLRDFLSRHKHLKVKLKVGDQLLEVDGASPKELAALLPQLQALAGQRTE